MTAAANLSPPAKIDQEKILSPPALQFAGEPGAPGLAGTMWQDMLFPPRCTCVWSQCTSIAGTGCLSLCAPALALDRIGCMDVFVEVAHLAHLGLLT